MPTYELIEGECLHELKRLADEGAQFDAIIADPPYCSGGFLPAQSAGKGAEKYVDSVRKNATKETLGNFNDGMNIRALMRFSAEWIYEARRCLKSPGYFFLFCDWRMLPTFSDAISLGEIIQRGIITWDKKNSRPNKGHFSQTSEFCIWGTKDKEKSSKFVVGSVFQHAAPAFVKRIHPTQKSVEMIAELLRILDDGATAVCDPFSGSGTTGVAALQAGLNYVGIERKKSFLEKSRIRLETALRTLNETGSALDKPKGIEQPLFDI